MKAEKRKVLIIDDNYRNIFALSAVLKAKGYNCIAASNVQEGLKILSEEQEIGILLMDMMMPEVDGYEFIPRLRAEEKTASIPIVAVTAQAMPGDREKCLNAGADGYVSKPVDVDELLLLLKKFLK